MVPARCTTLPPERPWHVISTADANQNTVASCIYNAWGNIVASSGSLASLYDKFEGVIEADDLGF